MGAILAGGESRRLGKDKATQRLAGRPLAQWVAAALAPLVQECWLISNHLQLHLGLDLPLVTDLIPGRGVLGGLLTALFYARPPLVLLAPCDTPFLQTDLLRYLVAQAQGKGVEAVVCQSNRGLEPLPAVFRGRLFSRLEAFLTQGDYRVREFLRHCRTRLVPAETVARFDPQEQSFLNLNTPAELRQAQRLVKASD
ncbi:MAG: molybdenum cofactor guanylyltransferase [Deltaproteobacteria bacterium]|nr:molybdenum cofactor guanylyltransferase [Deltaproteobacteria bacterium]MBW1953694.1 molybdenum cofactor guanylyltransferase [Deltaproteobacteria bacterium]MBW1987644.1 molybdenum cofactor guanylyltransferase [Deltaproteobacteria bacterium]MBW2135719.1 molybdenum cofactor guanylyltransferase [Deltaproteobacteria bacterium]